MINRNNVPRNTTELPIATFMSDEEVFRARQNDERLRRSIANAVPGIEALPFLDPNLVQYDP